MANNDLIKLSETEKNELECLRGKANLNQSELSEKAGISNDSSGGSYRRFLRKAITEGVDRYIIENIAKALGVKPTDFIDPDKWQRDDIKLLTRKFDSILEEKTKRFYGRQFIFNAFENFINQYDRGYFTLVGDPGSGKSAVTAYYIQSIVKRDCVYYFNSYTTGQNRADQFLENVCQQLIRRYGLNYPNLPQDLPKDYTKDGVFLTDLLAQISEKLQKSSDKKRLIIVIDALDEVNLSSQDEGTNVLYLPRYLPENVYFFLTRRRELETRLLFEASEEIIDLGIKKK